MSSGDTLSDLFSRLRNGQMVNKASVRHPASRLAFAVAQVLVREGYLIGVKSQVKPRSVRHEMELFLKYQGKTGAIQELRRVSKLSRRVYVGIADLPQSKSGLGRWILSTPEGVLSCSEARKKNVGGEVLGEVF